MTLTARIVSAPTNVALPTVSPTVVDATALRALLGNITTLPTAIMRQHGTTAGGGTFIWSSVSAADDSGTRFNAGGHGSSSAGWQRIYSGPLQAAWFGATGDGSTDDTIALQRALSAAGAGSSVSRAVELSGNGNYLISAGLELEFTGAGTETGVALRGGNPTRDFVSAAASRITWNGNTTTTAVSLLSRGCTVEGIAFLVAAGKTCRAAIDIDKGAGGAGTRCVVRRCQIFSAISSFVNGIVIGRSASENNLEFNDIEDVVIDGCSNAGISILSETGQSKSNAIRRVALLNCVYGITTGGGAGSKASFQTQSCSFRDCDTCVYLGGVVDYIALRDTDVEACGRVLYKGATADCWSICVDGARISLDDNVSSDGSHRTWIELHNPGPLILRNISLDYAGTTVDPALYKVSLDAFDDGYVVSEGNLYLSDNPWKDGGGGSSIFAVTKGDNYRTFSGGGPWSPSGFNRRKTGVYHLTGATADATQTLDNFSIVNADVAAAAAVAVTKLAAGSADQVLTTNGSTNAFAKLVNANVDAAAAIAVSKLAAGSADQVLTTNGSTDSFAKIVNANVDAAAAIAGTKISPDFGNQAVTTTGDISGAAGTFTGDVSIDNGTAFLRVGTVSIVSSGAAFTAFSYNPPDNKLIVVKVVAFGRADISNYLIGERQARFETYTSSNPTQIGVTTTIGTDASAGAGASTPWLIQIDASGTDVRVRVTGDAGHDSAWRAHVTIYIE